MTSIDKTTDFLPCGLTVVLAALGACFFFGRNSSASRSFLDVILVRPAFSTTRTSGAAGTEADVLGGGIAGPSAPPNNRSNYNQHHP
jgi:hypothetical protein